jgi:uncharacterized membrane protein
MLTTKFRRQLRREADLWTEEGLIDRPTYEQIETRYQFHGLEVEARNSFIALILGLGCLLIGTGLLTFVSANWQQFSKEWRGVTIVSSFLLCNLVGFYLWREMQGSKQRLGQGFLLLGSVILGGNIAMMGQMFHVRGELFQLLITWAIGILLMAYSLRLASLGIFAQIIMGMGYVQAYTSRFSWSSGTDIDPNWTYFVYEHMPIAIVCLFLPLGYLCRSPVIFTLTGIEFILSLHGNLRSILTWGSSTMDNWNFILAFCLPPLLFWGYGNLSQWWQGNHRDKTGDFPKISRELGVLSLAFTCFTLSFSAFWEYVLQKRLWRGDIADRAASWDGYPIAILTIGIWIYLIWQANNYSRRYPWDWMTTAIGGSSLLMALIIGIQFDTTLSLNASNQQSISEILRHHIYAHGFFWVLLLSLCVGLIRWGAANSDRRAFWLGLSLFTTRVIISFVMPRNDLMTKSVRFILCGICVMAIGLWFERNVRRLKEARGSAQS